MTQVWQLATATEFLQHDTELQQTQFSTFRTDLLPEPVEETEPFTYPQASKRDLFLLFASIITLCYLVELKTLQNNRLLDG